MKEETPLEEQADQKRGFFKNLLKIDKKQVKLREINLYAKIAIIGGTFDGRDRVGRLAFV